MKPAPLLGMIFLLILSCAPQPSKRSEAMDPRVEKFIATQIKDKDAAVRMERDLKGESFEDFLYSVYTGALKLDSTPDNSQALTLLGSFLEKERPAFDSTLIDRMQGFNGVKGNKTMMRSLILMTLTGVQEKRSKKAAAPSDIGVTPDPDEISDPGDTLAPSAP